MERLTKRDCCGEMDLVRCFDCSAQRAGPENEHCGMCEEGLRRAFERLAAYEDTGLEPSEIVHVSKKIDDVFRLTEQIDLKKLEHIKELADAENEGRLVVLPCRVGDSAFWVHNGVITECRVHRIQQNRTGLFLCLRSKVSHGAFRADLSLGETVFFTREEAEAALAKS